MVSKGNKAILVDSATCQNCAKCCLKFTYDDDLDFAVRMSWLKDRKITARDTSYSFGDGRPAKRIIINSPCARLECKRGKYRCSVYDQERPDFCNTYPDHIFYDVDPENWDLIKILIEENKEECPALQKITVKDVLEMLRKRKNDSISSNSV